MFKFSLIMLIFALLMLLMQTDTSKITTDPQFWVTLVLILTFATDMVRRTIQRRWDKQDREREKAEEQTERIDAEEQAGKDREQLAATIKNELKEQHAKEEGKRLLELNIVAEKIAEQKNTVDEIKEQVVTLAVAADHKEELKHAIEDTVQMAADKADKAYKEADTINKKLEAMSKAGLLNQKQEAKRKDVEPE